MNDWKPGPPGSTVYLLGAGFNKAICDWAGQTPPLIGEFFQRGLGMTSVVKSDSPFGMVLSFINKQFGRSRESLLTEPFDVEECLTTLDDLLDLEPQNPEMSVYFAAVRFRLTAFMAAVLSEFEYWGGFTASVVGIATHCLRESAPILTFNYDTIIESALESASGLSFSAIEKGYGRGSLREPQSDAEASEWSHYSWNRPLAYGFEFDEVQLQQAGRLRFVPGRVFYSVDGNELYRTPVLKLHGSLNWFRYLPIRSHPTLPGQPQMDLGDRAPQIIMIRGTWWADRPPDHDGWFIDPVVVAPTPTSKATLLRRPPFPELWERARELLENARKLVIIGYSFSRSDSRIRTVLRNVASSHTFEELVVVNPNQASIDAAKELCRFSGDFRSYPDLERYSAVEVPEYRKVRRLLEDEFRAAGLRFSSAQVACRCRTCGIMFPVSGQLPWSEAERLADSLEWTICPNGHRQLSGSGDREVMPAPGPPAPP